MKKFWFAAVALFLVSFGFDVWESGWRSVEAELGALWVMTALLALNLETQRKGAEK